MIQNARMIVGGQQFFHFPPQICIRATLLAQELVSLAGFRVQNTVKNIPQFLPLSGAIVNSFWVAHELVSI